MSDSTPKRSRGRPPLQDQTLLRDRYHKIRVNAAEQAEITAAGPSSEQREALLRWARRKRKR